MQCHTILEVHSLPPRYVDTCRLSPLAKIFCAFSNFSSRSSTFRSVSLLYSSSLSHYTASSTIQSRQYLLTPWCRVLLEQLTGLQLVKKFPAFHGTRMFITALTSVPHPSLSWASPIHSTYPHPTTWRSILILSTHLRLGLPSG
jgi:hypothetical protein